MNIKPEIYENLTPHQRILTTFEAYARGDKEEVERLQRTCPIKSYKLRDIAYSDKMIRIRNIALAIEYDLLNLAFLLTWANYCDNDTHNDALLQNMADIEAGWQACLAEQGLSKESMLQSIPPRNPLLAAVMVDLPPPDSEYVNKSLADLQKFIDGV